MFSYVSIILVCLGILCIALCIYITYCSITLKKYLKNPNKKYKANIFIKSLKNIDIENNKDKVRKKYIFYSIITYIILPILLYVAYMSITIAVAVKSLDTAITSFTSLYNVIFSSDEDCPCYALCTDDPETDKKSVYELIFGPSEYKKLTSCLKGKVTNELYEAFNNIDKSDDGKAKSDFLAANINDDMVQCYKNLVYNRSDFRSGDGKDRSSMSDEQLKEDLINLLHDYKVNGRNPNCECADASDRFLKRKCLGVAHWSADFDWEAWTNFSPAITQQSGYYLGGATGTNALKLDDGLSYFYWAQSSSTSGPYLGTWNVLNWGSLGITRHELYRDGCAVYSLAIIASNLTGTEITPQRLLSDFGCAIDENLGIIDTSGSTCFVGINGRSASYNNIISKMESVYGIKCVAVDKNDPNCIDTVNNMLNQGNCLAWSHWKSSFAWYNGSNKHFMVIRKVDENGMWYCLSPTSASNLDVCNKAEDPSIVLSKVCISTDLIYCFYNDAISNQPSSSSGTPGDALSDLVSVSGLDYDVETITLDTINNNYRIAVVNDLHYMEKADATGSWWTNHNITFEARRQNTFNNSGLPQLQAIINGINQNQFDLVIFNGDIIDNYGTNTYNTVSSLISTISIPRMVLLSDHDYLAEMTSGNINKALATLGTVPSIYDISKGSDNANSLVVVGVSDSVNETSGTQELKAIGSAVNSILVQHVPIEPKYNASAMESWSKSVHNGEVYYWSSNTSKQQYSLGSHGSEKAFISALQSLSSLRGVFTAHVHSSYKEDKFSDTAFERVFGASYGATSSNAVLNVIEIKTTNTQSQGQSSQMSNKNNGTFTLSTTKKLATGLNSTASKFFTNCTINKGKATKVLIDNIYLYDGLPWDNTKSYTLVNEAINRYLNTYLGEEMKSSIAKDGNCSSSGIEKDGVICVDAAATPILGFCDIDGAGQPIGWSSSTRPKKFCAILKDSSGTRYYLPLTCEGDAKGHAWPGGLCQTFLSNKSHKNGSWNFNSDRGNIKGGIIGKEVINIDDIRNGYSTVTYGGVDVHPQLNLEVNKKMARALNGYTLCGFISWKE